MSERALQLAQSGPALVAAGGSSCWRWTSSPSELIAALLALHEFVYVLPVLDIVHAHNTGAAFSFLAGAGGWQRWLFTGVRAAGRAWCCWSRCARCGHARSGCRTPG